MARWGRNTTTTSNTLATVKVSGMRGIDRSLIQPVSLEWNSDGQPSILTLKIHQPFDQADNSKFVTVYYPDSKTWGRMKNPETASALGRSVISLRLNDLTVFRGVIVSKDYSFSSGGSFVVIRAYDLSWLLNSDVVEYDQDTYIQAGDMINRIISGSAVLGETSSNYFGSTVKLRFDPAILGNEFRTYPMGGMPAFDAIVDIIQQAGNFIVWLEYDGTNTYINCRKRHTGKSRTITKGSDVVRLEGTQSCVELTNRWIGRGDRVIYETSVDNVFSEGNTIGIEKDWDTSLESAVLATPGLIYTSPAYANVGRRYVLSGPTDGIDGAGMLPSLVSSSLSNRGASGNRYDQRIQLFYNEPDNFLDWRPYHGEFAWNVYPLSSGATLGRGKINSDKGVALEFPSPQVYKTVGTSDTTFTGFRNFMATLSLKGVNGSGIKNWGRVSSDSGKRGRFPVTRTRMLRDNSMKYIKRTSYRMELESDESSYSVVKRSEIVRDDSLRLGRLVRNYASRNNKPISAFRIEVKGNVAPDISWRPGMRITKLAESDMDDVDWDVVGVVYNFEDYSTTLLTDDIQFFKEPAP